MKKDKFPVQILSQGDLLGEEVLVDCMTRQFTAECKSDFTKLYYIPGWVLIYIFSLLIYPFIET